MQYAVPPVLCVIIMIGLFKTVPSTKSGILVWDTPPDPIASTLSAATCGH